MAKALQCPACGNKTPLSALPDAPVFGCARCGRPLKIPAQLRSQDAAGAGGDRVSPPTATMAAAARAPAPAPPAAPTPARRRAAAPAPGPRPVARSLRLLAWFIAIPVGLVAVVYPARKLGFLSGQHLLDVIVDTGWGRYWRVVAIAPAWALVTTVLVQLMLVGIRRLAVRRERVRAERDVPLDEDPRWSSPAGARGRRGSRPRDRRAAARQTRS